MTSLLEECVCVRVCSCSFWCVLMCHFLCAGMQLKSGDLAIIASLLEKKTIKVVIDSTYSLYEIDKAHQRSETHRARGKIVVQVRGALKPGAGAGATAGQVPPAIRHGDVQAPLQRGRGGLVPQSSAPVLKGTGEGGGGGLRAVEEDEGVQSDEEAAVPMMVPGRGKPAAGPEAGRKGVSFDQYRPPGVDTPQKSPSTSPGSGGGLSPAATQPGPLASSAGGSVIGGSSGAGLLPESAGLPVSVHQEEDLRPSAALLGVGVRHGELAQRSGSGRTGASRLFLTASVRRNGRRGTVVNAGVDVCGLAISH